MTKMDHFAVLMFQDEDSTPVYNPNTAYTEDFATTIRTRIDFDTFDSILCRVVVIAQGNEAGAGKGIEIYNVSDAAQVCEVVWDGAALQTALAGSWTPYAGTGDDVLTVRFKGSSAGEDLTIWRVDLQLMYV